MPSKSRTRKSNQKKSKCMKNKTYKLNQPSANVIWGNYGQVLNIKTNRYVRIGSTASIKAISILKRDDEWNKRVNYITKHSKFFGERLKKYLEKNK